MHQPLVSIIAVCYNHERFVLDTLNSIINQTYSDIELIIIDDHSTDGSVNLINEWIVSNNVICRFIAHKKNQGVCKTVNEGLINCKGKYYHMIACDDILLNDKVQRQVALFERLSPDVALMYSDITTIDENNKIIANSYFKARNWSYGKDFHDGNIYRQLLKENFIPAASVLIKTDAAREIGGYDEDLFFEDYDFLLRLSKNYKIHYMDEVTAKYRILSTSMSHARSHRYSKAFLNIYFKQYNDPATEPDIKIELRERMLRDSMDYANDFGGLTAINFLLQRYKVTKNQIELNYLIGYILKKLLNRFYFNISKVEKFYNNLVKERDVKRLKKQMQKVKNKDFTIIASNCWGGAIYEELELQYKTPTVGLFFYAPCFMEFLKDLEHNIFNELKFIKTSKYEEANNFQKTQHYYPIGLLNNKIEIHFLHYHSEEEAYKKWTGRAERINLKNLFISITDRDQLTEELLKEFENLPFKNKVCFSASKQYSAAYKSVVFLSAFKGLPQVGDIYTNRELVARDFKINEWLNNSSSD